MKKILPDKNAASFTKLAIAFIAAVLIFAIRLFVPDYTKISAIILLILTAVLDFIYIPLYFRSLNYETDGRCITKNCGVIFHTSKTAEFSAVRYITSATTPFSQNTGLNFAVLFMYGGRLTLMFLSKKDMQEIVDLGAERAEI